MQYRIIEYGRKYIYIYVVYNIIPNRKRKVIIKKIHESPGSTPFAVPEGLGAFSAGVKGQPEKEQRLSRNLRALWFHTCTYIWGPESPRRHKDPNMVYSMVYTNIV